MHFSLKPTGILIFLAIIALLQTGCPQMEPEGEYSRTQSGTLYASTNGRIIFEFSNIATLSKGEKIVDCNFTTDLPAPDNVFILSSPADSGSIKIIGGLKHHQPVQWTAICIDPDVGFIDKEEGGILGNWVRIEAVAPGL